jgi:glucose-1-phosphate thymidylyltransferase
MKAIILAAGYATRLYPLTIDTPKPLLEVGSKTIADRIMEKIEEVRQVDTVYVVTNHRFHRHFEEWAERARPRYSKKVVVLDDGTDSDDNRKGAIGDIKLTVDTFGIDDDLLVLCGDNLFDYEVTDMVAAFESSGQDTICVKRLPDDDDLKRYAIVLLDAKGTVTDMEEKPQKPKSTFAAYGTYVYRRDTLPLLETYRREGNNMDQPGRFPSWLYERKPVHAWIFTEDIYDIGTHEALREVREKYR